MKLQTLIITSFMMSLSIPALAGNPGIECRNGQDVFTLSENRESYTLAKHTKDGLDDCKEVTEMDLNGRPYTRKYHEFYERNPLDCTVKSDLSFVCKGYSGGTSGIFFTYSLVKEESGNFSLMEEVFAMNGTSRETLSRNLVCTQVGW